MKNTYFSIDATLKQQLRRLQEYAQMSLPPEYDDLRLAADPPVPIFPEDGLAWLGTFYAVCTVEDDVPFFEMGVQEVDGTCRVRIRCLDPKAATWVRDMIRRLAPGRASRFVQPLPDLPARRAATTPAAAASETIAPALPNGSQNAPAQPSEQPQVPVSSVVCARNKGSNLRRPGFPDYYKKHQVAEYRNVRGILTQEVFCSDKPFTPRTLRSWIAWCEEQDGPG